MKNFLCWLPFCLGVGLFLMLLLLGTSSVRETWILLGMMLGLFVAATVFSFAFDRTRLGIASIVLTIGSVPALFFGAYLMNALFQALLDGYLGKAKLSL